jgi:hypothetical protein
VTRHEQEMHLRWLMRKGSVEIDLPWGMEPSERAAVALEMASRDPGLRWSWMHVPANGDWHSLTMYFADAVVRFGGGWTAEQANGLVARLRDVLAEASPLPPSPFAYARWQRDAGKAA